MEQFKLHSKFKPTGDQPQAIEKLARGVLDGMKEQTLMGVTGSGKTFTMANIIERVNRPTLVLAHNKTLAAQLCSEFREFFPENAVEYFVSYYDYYQPEAYVPTTDTYIEKDSAINDEIDKLRHSATAALSERRDVIIVASVSCIYSIGDPIDYRNMVISLRTGMEWSRDALIEKLVAIQYERNDINFVRNKFRVRGDTLEIFPAGSSGTALRVEFFGDEIDRICEIDPLTGKIKGVLSHACVYPASHYVVGREKMERALNQIYQEMVERVAYFEEKGKLLEAQRIKERTMNDIEMLRETGFCKGIENYSAVMSGRKPGQPPFTLLDYFPEDFLLFCDESHVMLPQVRGMYGGDRSRKASLIDYGFRLPSAFDNRPLQFDEFYGKINQVAKYLVDLFPAHGTVMTQCFGETIVGMMLKEAKLAGKDIRLFCPETRPYFQGARLTATVCRDMGFDVTVITDNMPAFVMEREGVDLFTCAADAICLDGYVVNKVGTLQIAICANHFGIPAFVTGAPDIGHPTKDTVRIEMRDPEFTLQAMGVRTAAEGVKGYYPAFDMTPPHLISGIVTDRGVFSPFDLHRYFQSGGSGEYDTVV